LGKSYNALDYYRKSSITAKNVSNTLASYRKSLVTAKKL
jgi:hypothetical protein